MIVDNFQKCSLRNLTRFVKTVYDIMVHEGSTALIDHLGLFLRIKILRKEPNDTDNLTLPGFENGTVLFKKIQDVFLWKLHALSTLSYVNLC